MDLNFIKAINKNYNLSIQKCVAAPRQFVAQTYVLYNINGKQYFCKLVKKLLFIPGIIKTLPIIEEMHARGIEKIGYLIRGAQGLHLFIDDTLVVLFNYINANQSFDYNLQVLGKTIAEIHVITPKIKLDAPEEKFEFPNRELFDERFEGALVSESADPIRLRFKKLLLKYEDEVRHNIDKLLSISKLCKERTDKLVLTHGDISTNVLVKSPDNIYIIDWDELRLAPAERDIWMLDEHPDFMKGYKNIRPDFTVNSNMRSFCILQYYFERMMYYFSEILDDMADSDYRMKCIKKLEQGRMAGWILPKLKEVNRDHT